VPKEVKNKETLRGEGWPLWDLEDFEKLDVKAVWE